MSGEQPTGDTVISDEEGSGVSHRRGRRMPLRAWALAAGTLVLGLFAGYSLSSSPIPPAALPTATPAEQPGKPSGNAIPGNGTYWVGTDVRPGLYHSYDNEQCSWTRFRDASAERRSAIAADTTRGDAYVQLRKGEFFDTERCSTWKLVDTGG